MALHHPHKLQKLRLNESVASVAAEQALRLAKQTSVTTILVLSNARFEAFEELMRILKYRGLRVVSPRALRSSSLACSTGYVYGTYAEMATCSKSRHFLGSPRSTFSAHIVTMRTQGTVAWFNRSGGSGPYIAL